MQRHPDLAALLLDQTEAKRVAQGEAMLQALAELTQAKQALSQNERTLAERNAQLALAGRAALVGSYAYEVNTDMLQISEGYAAVHGLPEGTTETTLSEWLTRVYQEDLGRVERFRDQMFASRQEEYNIAYRITRSDGEVRWIERRSSVSYSSVSYSRGGHPERVVGVSIDITERKRAGQLQRGRSASHGNGWMVAFTAPSRAAVDAAYAAAIAFGGTDEGPPGLRPKCAADYYGAYVRDPEGNKLHFVTRGA